MFRGWVRSRQVSEHLEEVSQLAQVGIGARVCGGELAAVLPGVPGHTGTSIRLDTAEVCVGVGLAIADAHAALCDELLEERLEDALVDAPVDSRPGVCRVEPATLQAVVAGAEGAVVTAVCPLHALGQVVEAVLEPKDLESELLVFRPELTESRVQEHF